MGCTGGIPVYKYKYFPSYRSIRTILKAIHYSNKNKQIENVYLVNVASINEFINVFKDYNFLCILKLCQESEIENIESLVLRKLEKCKFKKIEIIDIKVDNFEQIKNSQFIFVDDDFLMNMEINLEENKNKKITLINIHTNDNKNEIKMEMDIEIIKNEEEKTIYKIIEDENEDGIYKFQECIDKSIDLQNESKANIEKKKFDPEFDERFIMNDENNEQNGNNENEEEKNINDIKLENNDGNQTNLIKINNDENNNIITNNNDENLKKIDNNANNNKKIILKDGNGSNIDIIIQNNNDNNQNVNNIQEKETAKAPKAKLDEIIWDIIFSIQNSSTQKDIIMNLIQTKLREQNINNELEEKKDLDIIGNIKNSVIYYFLNNINNNKINNNSINTNKSLGGNDCDINNQNESNNLYVDDENLNERNPLLSNDNQEGMNNENQKEFNPFIFKQVKMFISDKCDKCDKTNNKIYEADCVKIILKEDYYDFDNYFNMKYSADCGNNCEFILKFESTPDILILVFHEPRMNKNFIKFHIDENIDVKKHLYKIDNLDSSKYKLIKALYLFNDIEDNKLYMDITDEEKNNYIPYALFYKKINNI